MPTTTDQPTILSDKQIIELCASNNPGSAMITPFIATSLREDLITGKKMPSMGCSSFGYDVRCGNVWKVAKRQPFWKRWFYKDILDVVDSDDGKTWDTHRGDSVVIPPHGYVMAETLEYFRMPDNVSAIVLGKSTLARRGLIVNCTPIEAGFEGSVVIEIFNGNPNPVRVHSKHGIAQFIFIRGETCGVSYRQRKGKYQGQTGVQLAKN